MRIGLGVSRPASQQVAPGGGRSRGMPVTPHRRGITWWEDPTYSPFGTSARMARICSMFGGRRGPEWRRDRFVLPAAEAQAFASSQSCCPAVLLMTMSRPIRSAICSHRLSRSSGERSASVIRRWESSRAWTREDLRIDLRLVVKTPSLAKE